MFRRLVPLLALAILAEILAVRSGREGGPLSLKSGRITVPG